ncbi:MAG: hypothetical protein BGO41_11675 [Clostridiales bacterium 38-18]|nr:MAG: hypothetical protein BGO41_11675 [Clostridiales bacterium 38-18]
MPRFIGNRDDFHKYIGPRVRNRVQQITLGEKKQANKTCAHCNKVDVELEAAHVHGKSRKAIIDLILEKYSKNRLFREDYLDVDLDKFEEELILLHQPINEFFIFLCRECHIKYDSVENETSSNNKYKLKKTQSVLSKQLDTLNPSEVESEILRVQRRIPRWFKNRDQFNSIILYSFLELYFENNGIVKLEELRKKANIDTFDQNFNQMKTIAPQNHGKIFEVSKEYVYLWEPVKEVILNNYKRFN